MTKNNVRQAHFLLIKLRKKINNIFPLLKKHSKTISIMLFLNRLQHR